MRVVVFAALALAGCAHSIEGIEKEPVRETYTSTKAPLVIARCLQEAMPGLDIQIKDGFVSVSNRNQFGAILMNWIVRETATGSAIEMRKTNGIAPGVEKSKVCF